MDLQFIKFTGGSYPNIKVLTKLFNIILKQVIYQKQLDIFSSKVIRKYS